MRLTIRNDQRADQVTQIEAEKKVQQLTAELAAAKADINTEQEKSSSEELATQREAEKAAAIEKAVAEATEKLRAELATTTDTKEETTSKDIDALNASHEQEIKKLTEEYEAKLAEAKAGAGTGASSDALKAAREDGVSAGKKELANKLTLLERKLQSKDASIAGLSTRNAELEQLLKTSNLATPALTAIPAATTEAKTTLKRTGSVSNGTAAPAASTNAASSPTQASKPVPAEGASASVGASVGVGRGAAPARGAARGTAPTRGSARGAAPRGRGRAGMTGGSVLDGVNAVLGAAANATGGGTSIAGAAKRPRESEGAITEGGSDLAKRLRSADAANTAAKPGEAAANTSTAAPTRILPPRNRQPPPAAQ